MARKREVPIDHKPFASLPVRMIETRIGGVHAAVHVSGALRNSTMPVVCIAGLQRNMSDFTDFAGYFRRASANNRALILIDLPGRGRADDRLQAEDYGTLADASDIADILAALGIGRAIFLGQGQGGQVVMSLAASHPLLIGGVVLLDSGPMVDSRGIVRLRNNLAHLSGLKGEQRVIAGFRRMLAGDYPDLSDEALDALSQRSHFIDKRGRAQPLFDQKLLTPLADIGVADVLTPQWPLFDALARLPLMILRTQLTDQLRRETYEEMVRRRPDALALTIAGQGSPALFDQHEEIEAVLRFIDNVAGDRKKRAA